MNSTGAFGLIALSFGLAFFIAKPMWADISSLEAQKAEYAAALESFQSIETIKASLQQQLDSLPPEERIKIETLLPEKPDTVKLIADIDAIGARRGIAIDSVTFTPTSKDTSGSAAGAAPQLPYMSTTVNFSFSSTYSNLKLFLADVESSLRLVDVRTINVGVGEKGTTMYRVSAEIYWLPETSINTQ